MFDGDTGAGTAESESKPAAETRAEKSEETKDDLDGIEGIGDKGKDAIRKEREAAKAAREEAKAAKEERDALKAEKEKREAEEAAAKEKEAAAKGEWEALAVKREGELKTAKDEAAALKGENDQLKTAIGAVLDAEWKDLPSEVRDAYLGAEDDPLAKLAFLPKGKALAAKLAGATETRRGNGRDPISAGGGKVSDDDKRKAQAGMISRF